MVMAALVGTKRGSGVFVTFEGGEGAGKSTQVRELQARIESLGRRVLATREPGGSPRAEAMRDFLLAGDARRFGPLAETMLFAAARADHVALTIRPALERGEVVICDRFADSTRVYQGALGHVPGETVLALEAIAVAGIAPDLTLMLDLPAELGLARAEARRKALGQEADRFERQNLAFHDGVRRGFLAVARAEPGRCVVVDASRPAEAVTDEVWRVVARRLGERLEGRDRRHVG